MAKRINITIPDDLAQALGPWRDQINISAVCADALQRKVDMLAATNDEDARYRELIARLRAERLFDEDHSEHVGFTDGSEWAVESARYPDIQWFVQDFETDPVSPELGDRVQARFPQLHDRSIDEIELNDCSPEHYWEGFRHGVLDVWGRVRSAVEK